MDVQLHAVSSLIGLMALCGAFGAGCKRPAELRMCDAGAIEWDAIDKWRVPPSVQDVIEAAARGDAPTVQCLVSGAEKRSPVAAFALACADLGTNDLAGAREALGALDHFDAGTAEAKLLTRLLSRRESNPGESWLDATLAAGQGLALNGVGRDPLARALSAPYMVRLHGPVSGDVAAFVAATAGYNQPWKPESSPVSRSIPDRAGEWKDPALRKIALMDLEQHHDAPAEEAAQHLREQLLLDDRDDLAMQLELLAENGVGVGSVGEIEDLVGRGRLLDVGDTYRMWRERLHGTVDPADERPLAASVAESATTSLMRFSGAMFGFDRMSATSTDDLRHRLAKTVVTLAQEELDESRVGVRRNGYSDLVAAYKLAPDPGITSQMAARYREVAILQAGLQDLEWLRAWPLRPLRDELFDAEMASEVALVDRLIAPNGMFHVSDEDVALWGKIFGVTGEAPVGPNGRYELGPAGTYSMTICQGHCKDGGLQQRSRVVIFPHALPDAPSRTFHHLPANACIIVNDSSWSPSTEIPSSGFVEVTIDQFDEVDFGFVRTDSGYSVRAKRTDRGFAGQGHAFGVGLEHPDINEVIATRTGEPAPLLCRH